MPNFIVKPVTAEDFYVAWSTIVDAPTAFGSREELAGLLRGDESKPERFDRADEYGTSMQDPELPRDHQWFGWHDEAFMLREWPIPNARYDEGTYEVPRENVRALCERYPDGDPTDLLIFHPFEDLAENRGNDRP